MTTNPTCCLCGRECENQWGNNPWPLAQKGVCCDDCNDLVTATRLSRITGEDPGEICETLRLTRLQAEGMMKKKVENPQ